MVENLCLEPCQADRASETDCACDAFKADRAEAACEADCAERRVKQGRQSRPVSG